MKLEELNSQRTVEYKKEKSQESFLEHFNSLLEASEKKLYTETEIKKPVIFVFGLPRSGTTLLSQFVSGFFELGFINNIAARFYDAPLHGVRFSKNIFPKKEKSKLSNEFAKTSMLTDIHEFGYFWKKWLKKGSLAEIAAFESYEKEIEWNKLRNCLGSIQEEFGSGIVFKSILSAYHIPKFVEILKGNVLFLYIERDELDVAVSIYNARKKYYGQKIEQWWSYAPPEVLELINLSPKSQIAGQIHFLKKFYENEFLKVPEKHVLKISYEDMCNEPGNLAKKLTKHLSDQFDYKIELSFEVPEKLHFRTYSEPKLKKEFHQLINEFRSSNTPL